MYLLVDLPFLMSLLWTWAWWDTWRKRWREAGGKNNRGDETEGSRMKGWVGGNQGRLEEADKELDEEGEEGHRKFICGGKEGGRGRIWRKGHYYRRFKEERDSGNILLFQTYIKHDTNTPSDRKLGRGGSKLRNRDSEGGWKVCSCSHCVLCSHCNVTEFMF